MDMIPSRARLSTQSTTLLIFFWILVPSNRTPVCVPYRVTSTTSFKMVQTSTGLMAVAALPSII